VVEGVPGFIVEARAGQEASQLKVFPANAEGNTKTKSKQTVRRKAEYGSIAQNRLPSRLFNKLELKYKVTVNFNFNIRLFMIIVILCNCIAVNDRRGSSSHLS
jgi:hypothetical protein